MTEQEFIKKLPTIDNYYVIFCDFTKMPYAECDEQTFDDKAFIFLKEAMAKKFVEEYKEDGMILSVKTTTRAEILGFLTSLPLLGINMASFRGNETHNIQLDNIVKRQYKEDAPKPVENPSLQLSMIYFMQAVRIAETEEENAIARQFEEEMMVNIARGHFLVPSREIEETDDEGNKKVAFLQVKNNNGDVFIPLFTDINEYFKFNSQDGTMKFLVLDFNKIYNTKVPQLTGFIINPGTISVLLNEQHLNAIHQAFGEEA
ncbi:MAG: SseB family protein [Lachnospiraceae bacterium]|nr:SseB family protein [Lachnospiraceae bacterium]